MIFKINKNSFFQDPTEHIHQNAPLEEPLKRKSFHVNSFVPRFSEATLTNAKNRALFNRNAKNTEQKNRNLIAIKERENKFFQERKQLIEERRNALIKEKTNRNNLKRNERTN